MTAVGLILLAAQLATAAPKPQEIEILLFSDFQCPFCAQLAGPIRELQAAPVDGVTVNVRFRNYPLGIHPKAGLAHRAAVAAGQQNRFWEMHDLLFANRQHAEREDLIGYARQIGLDMDRFTRDLDSDQVLQTIKADQAEGTRHNVTGTPTFYVNGREYVGTRSLAQLRDIVAGERRRARALEDVRDGTLARGPSGAVVTIELFADLQSPLTRPALNVLTAVGARYAADVRLQFRNLPLAFHPRAALAHEAAMIAARDGRFWEFAAALLEHPEAVREPDLIALAVRVGLDESSFVEALRDHRYAPRVAADLDAADRRGIRGSPAIVVNGKRIDGVPSPQALAGAIDAALESQLTKRP